MVWVRMGVLVMTIPYWSLERSSPGPPLSVPSSVPLPHISKCLWRINSVYNEITRAALENPLCPPGEAGFHIDSVGGAGDNHALDFLDGAVPVVPGFGVIVLVALLPPASTSHFP